MTRQQIETLAETLGGDAGLNIVRRWFERGDGAAVYQNHDLGHRDVGETRIVSFGSAQAQLETNDPPQTLPDIGGAIGWRFQLTGSFRPDRSDMTERR